jgi:hypothetical protein
MFGEDFFPLMHTRYIDAVVKLDRSSYRFCATNHTIPQGSQSVTAKLTRSLLTELVSHWSL